ncbi:alpha-ketoacid dehydrogenase subunit beta [Thiohalobacter sp.]|uniref:alpha-ketoacid dehydrogenase subunit beta n=1 Tax=Thiohalobacter sp. TaxID=2025948 RepID=UPI002620DBAB|nr:alpha-ketoacid dehydrogenase subunit beta [Thiohalobacter sp.]
MNRNRSENVGLVAVSRPAPELRYWEALNIAHDRALAADESVFVLGEDVGLYGGSYRVTQGLYARYGEWRVRDTPISENSFTGLGVGAALVGGRPIVEIMTVNFALLALDAIINMAAKLRYMSGGRLSVPLVVRMPGGVAHQLAAQHSQRLEHTLMNVPGLRIAAPATPQDAYWQLLQAVRSDDPVILLEHELLYGEVGSFDAEAEPPPMHAAAVRRRGRDLTLVAWHRMVKLAMEAADRLDAEDGISAEVIDLRSLRPIDLPLLRESVSRTHRVLIVEEDCRFAGAGAELVASLTEAAFFELDAPVQRVAGADVPTPYNATLEARSIPDVARILHAARSLAGPREQ